MLWPAGRFSVNCHSVAVVIFVFTFTLLPLLTERVVLPPRLGSDALGRRSRDTQRYHERYRDDIERFEKRAF